MVGRELWEIVKEGFAKALAKSNLDWVEHTFGIKPGKFAEHVAVEVIAALVVLTVIGLASFSPVVACYTQIRRKFRAATIRKTASTSLRESFRPIANDDSVEPSATRFRAVLNDNSRFRRMGRGESGRPFHVMEFPLPLSGDEGTKAYDKAIETAKRWLERTNGDILIWGKRVKGKSVGMVRLIGQDRKKGVIEVRQLDFDKRASDFDQALANAIAYECARLTQVTLSEPELVNLETLREISDKLKRLASSDAPALSNKWRDRMAAEYCRLTEEIIRRTPSATERGELETEVRREIASLDPLKHPDRFAEAALRLIILVRKRSWADPNENELDEIQTLAGRIIPTFENTGDVLRAAETALEQFRIQLRQDVFQLRRDPAREAYLSEARRLVELISDERLHARLVTAMCIQSPSSAAPDICSFEASDPKGAFDFINRIGRHLDNGELIDLVDDLETTFSDFGDRTQSVKFWRALPQLAQAVLDSRSHWTADERTYLHSLTAGAASVAALRLLRVLGGEAAASFYELSDRLTAKIVNSFDMEHPVTFSIHRSANRGVVRRVVVKFVARKYQSYRGISHLRGVRLCEVSAPSARQRYRLLFF